MHALFTGRIVAIRDTMAKVRSHSRIRQFAASFLPGMYRPFLCACDYVPSLDLFLTQTAFVVRGCTTYISRSTVVTLHSSLRLSSRVAEEFQLYIDSDSKLYFIDL